MGKIYFTRQQSTCSGRDLHHGKSEWVYIVGAHSRAQTLAVYLKYLYPDTSIEAYLVNNEEKNPEFIGGIPVIHFHGNSKRYSESMSLAPGCSETDTKYLELYTEYPVYIGTRGIYHEKLISELQECGFTKIYPVTVERDLRLRNAYLERYFTSIGREFVKIDQLDAVKRKAVGQPSRAVYVVRSTCDKELQQPYDLADYETEIQAGAALTQRRLSEEMLTDASGDNISYRNKQFCELTALYWIWKNASEEVVGMVHYRRHFILPEDWCEQMESYNIDAILPTPLYVAPSLAENYRSRHDSSDWDYMMEYLKIQDEEIYQGARDFFGHNLYSPCNMFIVRKSVLNDLCKWLFPILDAVAAHGWQKEDNYLNRYPGFISERLISYFFERYRDKYKMVYADKNFLP